jgi:hypothetical protein
MFIYLYAIILTPDITYMTIDRLLLVIVNVFIILFLMPFVLDIYKS